MNTIQTRNNKKLIYKLISIFTIFFIFLFIEQYFIYLYADDFGYATLSYISVTPNVSGTEYSFIQFLQYYEMHYLTVTGRVFWQCFTTLILKNIWVARFMQSIMITFLMVAITYVLSKNTRIKTYMIAIVVCSLYGFIGVFVIDKSIFWFSAAVLYVWPFIPFFLVCSAYWRDVYKNRKITQCRAILYSICIFFTSTAQEQVAVAQTIILILIVAYKWFKMKKVSFIDILFVACSVLGFLFVALSPATSYKLKLLEHNPAAAQFEAMSMKQRIVAGVPKILNYIFSKNFFLIILCMLGCGAFASLKLFKDKKRFRSLNLASAIFFLACFIFMLLVNDGINHWAFQIGISRKIYLMISIILILLLVFTFVQYYHQNKRYFMFFAFIAAWASIFSIAAVVDPASGRLYIPFVLLTILMMGDIITDMIMVVRKMPVQFVMIGLLVLIAASNMYSYSLKYYYGSGIQNENEQRLRTASEIIKSGQEVDSITILSYLNIESDAWNPTEGIRRVYTDPVIIFSLKEYYGIPQNVQLYWTEKQ